MKKAILIFIFYFFVLPLVCRAGEVQYCTPDGSNCYKITYIDKYSFKDFTGRSLIDAKDLKGGIIYASTFYQEAKESDNTKAKIQKHIFPEDMKGITFIQCNLNNVYIPPGNTVIDSCGRTKMIKVQNDLSDWELNDDLSAKEPLDKEERIKLGVSIDPKDIPITKMSEYIIDKKIREDAQKINP